MQLRHLLLPLTPVYAGLVSGRELAYRVGLFRTKSLNVPVLCVGNLTFGGTGKTPTVLSLVRELVRCGHRPGVLTRGYRREGRGPVLVVGPDPNLEPERIGDEALELAIRLPGVPIAVDADRLRGGTEVLRRGADVIVLDDGFQHRRLARDLDIVLLDAGDPWGGGRFPPLGRLREPVSALQRAGAVVVTKISTGGNEFEKIRAQVHELVPGLPVFGARLLPTRLRTPGGEKPTNALRGLRVFAFAGLGRPRAFCLQLEELGAEVVGQRFFRDHHKYLSSDLEGLRAEAKKKDAVLLTTAKDAVKLPNELGAWILEVEMAPVEGSWSDVIKLCPRL